MAIIKCKMCGGDIEISADKTFGTCEYCGSTMTLPKVDDEQRAAAFNRGNHFRRSGEFDKALAVYERIVAEDDNDAEAHWCCALCRFGIEYVEDPATYEWLPTCHRASFDSFLEDVDYLAAVEHSDGITRRQYQKDAAKIAEVQRGILATSQNEQPFDVFLCYKETGEDGQRTRDSLMAQEVYYELTEQGYRVFFARITLEDKAGTEYEPYIFAALNSAKVMVVIGTKPEHFNAVWVKNEWSRFLSMMKKDRSKLLLPCYRDMDPYDLPEALSVLQSYDMSKIGFMQDLIRGVKKVLDAGKPQEAAKETVKETVVVHNEGGSNVQALLDRGQMALEDGEWTKADEFFEQVLNQDAKCGAAYLGKFLARVKCRSAKAYADAFIGNVKANVPSEKNAYACEEDKAFAASCMEKYTVHGILSENEIRQALKFDSGYCMTSDYYAKAAENAHAQLTADKDLMRAVKYASGEAKTITENIPQTLDTLRRDAEQREKVECATITANYRDFLTKTEAKLEKEHPQRLKEAEEAKKAAVKTRKNMRIGLAVAVTVIAVVLIVTQVIIPSINYSKAETLLAAEDYDGAIAAFEALENFKDSKEQHKAALYGKAITLLQAENYAAAYELLENLNYKDSEEKASTIYAEHPIDIMRTAQIGDTVFFGKYEQDNDTSNGNEAIEWLVLDVKDDRILVISKYILDCMPFDSYWSWWDECTLRRWLNGTFRKEAFSEENQMHIPKVQVSAERNPSHNVGPGKDTQDWIFLLNIQETEQYFDSEDSMQCRTTPYVDSESDNLCMGWWLRSTGKDLDNAAVVFTPSVKSAIDRECADGYYIHSDSIGVRPAMWIDLGE